MGVTPGLAACNALRLTPALRAMAARVSPAATVWLRNFTGAVCATVVGLVGAGFAGAVEISSGVGLTAGVRVFGCVTGEFFCADCCAA